MPALTVREVRLPDDEPHLVRFIAGLNEFEAAIEPDRAVGDDIAVAWLGDLKKRNVERQGRMLIAERDGVPVGWAMGYVSTQDVIVKSDWRKYGYINELYVEAEARRDGVGSALIASLEEYFRSLDLPYAMIGVLAANHAARGAYERAGYRINSHDLRKML